MSESKSKTGSAGVGSRGSTVARIAAELVQIAAIGGLVWLAADPSLDVDVNQVVLIVAAIGGYKAHRSTA